MGTEQMNNTKPSIDWETIPEQFKFLAMIDGYDKGLLGIIFTNKPSVMYRETYENDQWVWEGISRFIFPEENPSFVPGTCHWTESLIER